MVLEGSLSLKMLNSTKLPLELACSVKTAQIWGFPAFPRNPAILWARDMENPYRICKDYVGFQLRAGDMVGNH